MANLKEKAMFNKIITPQPIRHTLTCIRLSEGRGGQGRFERRTINTFKQINIVGKC